jgi:hypothetical protein
VSVLRRASVACLLLLLARSGSGQPAPAAGGESSARELLQRLESAWRARDVKAYLALWEFATVDSYDEERQYAEQAFAAEESQLQIDMPPVEPGRDGIAANLDVFSVSEPRGRVDQWLLSLVRRPGGWKLVRKQPLGQIEGLIHLSLDPTGFDATGMTLRFEDFELQMADGSLFLSPPELGPTLLVFVGSGEVRFRPAPEAEREQLRQFSGRPELVERVENVLVRLHPADLHHVLHPAELRPDASAARRLPAAQRLFKEQGSRAFVLEGAAPRSPWWLLPSVGDAAITFETRRRGTLTFAASDDAEGLSLFDRDKRRYICLYPRAGRSTSYSEDDGRSMDILDHDLRVRFDPLRESLIGEDTLRVQMLAGVSTLRLKLDDALRVESVSSPQAGRHLFFRVRNQDSLMISLGALSGLIGELRLTVRYSGTLRPGSIESELLMQGRDEGQGRLSEDEIPLERVLTYTNREAWYPQGGTDDFATARIRFDVPLGFVAVTGGARTEARIAGERNLIEYVQDRPGRYITAVVGRLHEVGSLTEAGVELRAFAVPRLRGEAATAMRVTAEMLRFYTSEFGPVPYPRLNLIWTEGHTPGGHSPPGMLLLQRRPMLLRATLRDDPASFPDAPDFHLAHELAHQWWGHGVAPQNYRERWISEGSAQYAAALWVQKVRGEEAFQNVLRQLSRWALKHTAFGPIHLGYRLGQLKGDQQIFRAIVYDKGAYVLHMLRGVVGPEKFREALRSLQSERRFQKIGSEHVRAALEKASGRELKTYFDEWIDGTRLPTLRVSQRAVSGGVRVDVAASDLPGAVPLEIEISGPSGSRVERVTLDPAGGSWTFPAPASARVEVNSNRELLAIVVKG